MRLPRDAHIAFKSARAIEESIDTILGPHDYPDSSWRDAQDLNGLVVAYDKLRNGYNIPDISIAAIDLERLRCRLALCVAGSSTWPEQFDEWPAIMAMRVAHHIGGRDPWRTCGTLKLSRIFEMVCDLYKDIETQPPVPEGELGEVGEAALHVLQAILARDFTDGALIPVVANGVQRYLPPLLQANYWEGSRDRCLTELYGSVREYLVACHMRPRAQERIMREIDRVWYPLLMGEPRI